MAEQDFAEVLGLSDPKGSGFSTLYVYKYIRAKFTVERRHCGLSKLAHKLQV